MRQRVVGATLHEIPAPRFRWKGLETMTVLLLLALLSDAAPAQRAADLPQVAPRDVPLLPLPDRGRQVVVSTADELAAAVNHAQEGDVILLADGTYRVGRFLSLDKLKNVSIRGASNDPRKVILQGQGFDVVSRGDDILRIARCENITVA
jgi:hypothetical protein